MSELDLIRWIVGQNRPSQAVPIPPGDDLAGVAWDASMVLVGIDQVLEDVHFKCNEHSPEAIAAKVVNRNISDCAAMGCNPVALVISAALPKGIGDDYAKRLQAGCQSAADAFGCRVVGGDVGSWAGKLALSVAIIGRMEPGVSPVRRSGAMPGDQIIVTGALGGSILGRHMTFTPRIEQGKAIAAMGVAGAMIDISDGVALDLSRICEASGVGAVIEAEQVPIHDDAVTLARQTGRPPLEHALYDGEDHELLACLHAGPLPDGAIVIGQIVEGTGMLLSRGGRLEHLNPAGWQHAF